MKIKNIVLILNVLAAFSAIVYYKIKKVKCKNDFQATDFVVGTSAQYAPWMSVNQQGEYEGFDNDIAKAVAGKMDKKLVLKDLGSMTALFIALQEGSIDAIIWGISITKDRLEKVAMIRYSGKEIVSYPLLFWNGVPENIKTVQDLKDMTVAVESGSCQDAALSCYDFINKKYLEKIDDGLLDIQYKKSDALLVEQVIAQKFLSKYPSIGVFDVPLYDDHKVFGVGICIKKDKKALIDAVQKAVEELQKEGTIATFEKQWGLI